jgi:WD40 repeat protein
VKRSISIIILSALLLASVFSLAPTQAQDNIQSWPFIYYYSYKTGSWIIERADGSDGFAFGAGLNCGTIDSADWSPSGRWLLWHCNQREYYWTNRWIAVSADNSRRVTALDPFNDLFDDYVSARWSPTSDLILVNTIYRPSAPEQKPEWGPGVYVIDANRDEIVLQVTFDSLIDRAEWSPDGRYVLAYSLEPYDEETDQITVIPVNGEPSFIHENVSRQAANTYTMPHLIWTPDSRLITQPPNTALLVLEDLSTGARQELPFTTTPINYVEYSPDQQHGLIYAGSELWLYAVSTGTLTQIADDVILPQFDPHASAYNQPSFQLPGWSPDGSRALFATQNGRLHWLHADGHVTSPNLPPAEESPTPTPRVQWGGDMAFILWNNIVYIYDLPTESVLSTFTQPDTSASYRDKPPLQDVQVSSDGRYLAHRIGRFVFGYYVWDWKQDVDQRIAPNPAIGDGERLTNTQSRWYPGQDVLFVAEPVDLAGPGLSRWSVASPDGRLQRALSSADSAGAPQALPERVDTSFIPSSTSPVVPEPVLKIVEDGVWPGILSWSPDGRYLASAPTTKPWRYSGPCIGGRPAIIYDAATGKTITEFPFEGCPCGYNPPTAPDDRLRGAYLSADFRAVQGGYTGHPLGFAWPQREHNTVLAMVISQCKMQQALIFWDFTTDEVLAEYAGVRAVAFSPDGTRVALGYDDGRVALTTYPEIDPQAVFATLPTAIDRLVFSADGSRLAITSLNDSRNGNDGELSVWDTVSGTAFFRTTPNPASDSIGITPDGTTLVLAAQQPYRCVDLSSTPPTLIDAATGQALNEPNRSLTAAAISPDGRYLAGTGCGLVVWDSDTLDVVADFLGNGIDVVWSPDETKLAAATRFGIYVWDMP